MCEGIARELDGIDLGDRRLNQRSQKIVTALAAHCGSSINAAMSGWADTQAAYRFFSNEQVTPDEILAPHVAATHDRIRQQATVLVLQDSTAFNFSAHPARDQQCLCEPTQRGFYQHVNLAVTPQRLPLGVLSIDSFDRSPEALAQPPQRRTRDPIETKESFRWLSGFRLCCDLAVRCPATQIVSIADREADLYDIFLEAQQVRGAVPNVHYVLRAHEDRSTPERDLTRSRRTYHKVRTQVAVSPLRTRHVVELSATPQRPARQALLEVRALTVTVKPPNARSGLPAITHNVILVQEVDPPPEADAVEWLLLTTLPIETVDDILRIVDHYAARWTIEVYFRTLKTGCRVEQMQLETKSRQLKCLVFYHIIAWRILFLTYQHRTCPHVACTSVLSNDEWKPVWCVVMKQPLPKHPPTLSEFIPLLAQLGGYNRRRGERPPGPQPLWIGIRRMLDYSAAWLAFGPKANSRCV
jgi:hypothetical protein